MVHIKVLGTGCAKCRTLTAKVTGLVESNGLSATVTKVEDFAEIVQYGILSTPGLVINGRVRSAGIIPSDEKILAWINEG